MLSMQIENTHINTAQRKKTERPNITAMLFLNPFINTEEFL